MSSPRATGLVWGLAAVGILFVGVGPVAGVMGRWQAAGFVAAGGVIVGLLAAWRAAAQQLPKAGPRETGHPRA